MRSTAAAEPARIIRTREMVAMFAEVPQPQLAGRRAVSLSLALCLAVLLCGSVARAQSVAFINPGKSDEIYWVTATQGMQAAARTLGMTFRSAICAARASQDARNRPRNGRTARRQAARIYRDHGRLFRGRPALGDHRPCRREDFSRL